MSILANLVEQERATVISSSDSNPSLPPPHRIRAEFREMPGMRITVDQAAKIFAVDPLESKYLLDQLVGEESLACNLRGAYHRQG